jgi:predicted amidophosphoribosyltransferase
MSHEVRCPFCSARFDLFEARWCEHAGQESSKVCPECGKCLCRLPDYKEPRLWKQAPLAFRKRGFRRIFVRYL